MDYYRIAFNKYAVFDGRARRGEFWVFFLVNQIVLWGVGFISPFLSGLFSLAVIIPYIAVGIRRMHDVNKSGWYFLFPLYNLILAFTDGTQGDNEYGVDPKTEDQKESRPEKMTEKRERKSPNQQTDRPIEHGSSKNGTSVTEEFFNKHLRK